VHCDQTNAKEREATNQEDQKSDSSNAGKSHTLPEIHRGNATSLSCSAPGFAQQRYKKVL